MISTRGLTGVGVVTESKSALEATIAEIQAIAKEYVQHSLLAA